MSQVVAGTTTHRLTLVTDERPGPGTDDPTDLAAPAASADLAGSAATEQTDLLESQETAPAAFRLLPAWFPLEAAVAAVVALAVVAVVRGVEPLVLLALTPVTLLQVLRAGRSAGARLLTVLSSTVRAVFWPAAGLALALHVLDLPRRAVDDALVLGALAALPAGVVAALVSRRSRPPRVVVVGDLPQVRGLVARWIDDSSVHVVGGLVLGSDSHLAESGLRDLGIAPVGTIADVVAHVTTHPADLVVVAPGPAVSAADVRRLSWALERTSARVALIGATEHVSPHRIAVDVVAGSTMTVLSPPRPGAAPALAKAWLDRLLAVVIAAAVLPVVGLLALAVRLDSRGPGFFTQVRVGRDGRLFTLYKLRTMRVDAEDRKAELCDLDEGNGVLFKIREDPRVTRLGRVLRRTSLDELPQVLNVLKGDMSLVGPRPALPEEVARYTDLERRRLAVKPGITGLWQVSGRSSLSREQSMQLDTSYVDNWRPRGDAAILLRTLGAVVSRRGAY